MAKAWDQPPLWEKCFLRPNFRVYLHAGRIIGHKGINGFGFYDEAKKLPFYNKLLFENAVRDLTVYEPRERGDYQLHATAKRVLRIIIGPAPDDPEYAKWWRLRLISVEQMKRDGHAVEFAEAPPVPLPDDKPVQKPTPSKKPARKKAEPKTAQEPKKKRAPRKKSA